jgi:hypothetical protein
MRRNLPKNRRLKKNVRNQIVQTNPVALKHARLNQAVVSVSGIHLKAKPTMKMVGFAFNGAEVLYRGICLNGFEPDRFI